MNAIRLVCLLAMVVGTFQGLEILIVGISRCEKLCFFNITLLDTKEILYVPKIQVNTPRVRLTKNWIITKEKLPI